MKGKRQAAILQIIQMMDVETQEELGEQLRNRGINVKQSTLSRDIKELRLTKVLSSDKKYKYAAMEPNINIQSEKLMKIFAQSVLSVEKVDKMIIVKTISGSASAAAEALDTIGLEGIAGTIAGDNTIFILVRSEELAEKLVQKIHNILNNK